MSKVMKKDYGLRAIILFGVVVPLIFMMTPFGFIINTSASLPYTVFFSWKRKDVSKDDYAYFVHPEFNQVIVKKIIGVPGDQVLRKEGRILVSDSVVGNLKPAKSCGSPLIPVSEQIIPEGKFFVAGTSEGSYDSRYQNFGLIRKDQVIGRVWPLF